MKVLFFVCFRIFPPRAGNARRALEMIRALDTLGHEVIVASPASVWGEEAASPGLPAGFRRASGAELRLLASDGGPEGGGRAGAAASLYASLGAEPPREMTAWLERRDRTTALSDLLTAFDPDVFFTTYFDSDQYVDHDLLSHRKTILDAVDLMSLNVEQWVAIDRELPSPPIDPFALPADLFALDYYDRLELSPWEREFRAYDKYDHVIAIVEQEAETIRRNASPGRVSTVPATHEPVALSNRYDGDAFLPTGPNPFNVHGVLLFCRLVLPSIRRRQKAFRLRVSGHCWNQLVPQDGVVGIEFADLEDEYRSACFLLCPVFGGTGQQVKIVEAMAHGVPVIAFRRAAERSPLRHGENGLIADSVEEFAEHALALWNDRARCREMGAAARATVSAGLSRVHLVRALDEIL